MWLDLEWHQKHSVLMWYSNHYFWLLFERNRFLFAESHDHCRKKPGAHTISSWSMCDISLTTERDRVKDTDRDRWNDEIQCNDYNFVLFHRFVSFRLLCVALPISLSHYLPVPIWFCQRAVYMPVVKLLSIDCLEYTSFLMFYFMGIYCTLFIRFYRRQ